MEELMISPSSSSSLASLDNSAAAPANTCLQQRLQLLFQNQPEWWAYSIFWRTLHDNSGRLILAWGDGHFLQGGGGGGGASTYPGPNLIISSASSSSSSSSPSPSPSASAGGGCSGDDGGSGAHSSDRMKIIKEIQALTGDTFLDIGISIHGDVSDVEWFYVMSMTCSFSAGDGTLPGRVLGNGSLVWLSGVNEIQFCNCERAKEAQLRGIQTLVCIPTPDGVLELGSTNVVRENWALIQQAKSLFGLLTCCHPI